MRMVRWPRAWWARDPGDARRERLGQQQVVEQLPPVVPQPGRRRPLVAAVEGAEEVAPVAAVEGEQRRGLGQQVGDEGGPLDRGQVAGGQPGVGVDHVGGDEGVLEVEGGQVAVGGEDVLPGPVGAVGLDRLARRRPDPGVLDDRRQVDLPDVGGPVDGGRVEAEGRPGRRRPCGPTGRGGGPPGRGPRSRCRPRRARRSRGPGRPAGAAPRGRPSTRPACPGWAASRPPARPATWPWRPGTAGAGPGPGRGTTTRAPRWAGRPGRRAGAPGTRPSPARPAGRSGTGSGPRRPRGTPTARRTLGRVVGADGSRASPATAMMAATTRSTGMTSVTPSGTPGNSRSRPRA